MNRRILTLVYSLCICIAFLNYISLRGQLEYLQFWIPETYKLLSLNNNARFIAMLEGMKFEYFLTLSRLIAGTILCVGFAIICQWRLETLQLNLGPMPNSLMESVDKHPRSQNILRSIRRIVHLS